MGLVADHAVHHAAFRFGGAVRYIEPRVGPLRDVYANYYFSHRWQENVSGVFGTGARVHARVGDLSFGADTALNFGTTREVTMAYQKITNDPIFNQQVLQGGARVTVRYDRPKWGAYLEGDYASGSDDPTRRTKVASRYARS